MKLLLFASDDILDEEIVKTLENGQSLVYQRVATLDQLYLQLSARQPQVIVLDDTASLLGFNDHVADELARDPNVRVIALTEENQPLPSALAGMIDQTLTKPVDSAEMLQAIHAAMDDIAQAGATPEPDEPDTGTPASAADVGDDPAYQADPAAWVTDAALGKHYLDLFFSETEAQGAFIYHQGQVWAEAGNLPAEDLDGLALIIAGNWNAQNNYDLVKYIKLSNSHRQFCLYVTQIHEDYLLAMVYDVYMTLSEMRKQSATLTRRLEVVLFKQHSRSGKSAGPALDATTEHDADEDAPATEKVPTLDAVLQDDRASAGLGRSPAAGQWSAEEPAEPEPASLEGTDLRLAWLTPLLQDAQAQQAKQIAWQQAEIKRKAEDAAQQRRLAAEAAALQADNEKTLPPFGQVRGFKLPWEAGGAPATSAPGIADAFISEFTLSPEVLNAARRGNGQEVAYTFVLVPKSGLNLIGEIAAKLQEILRSACQAYTWELKESRIQADCLQWSLSTLMDVSQGKVVRIIRQVTSERLQMEMPELQGSQGIDDLWMPGYLAAKGINTIPKSVIQSFIHQAQQRQQDNS